MTTPKRNPARRRFERELEASLDRMSATKEERVAARRTFAIHADTGMKLSRAVTEGIRTANGIRSRRQADGPALSA